ncbi:hypothetical protein [Brooklawnia cerclae]|uniref:Uncharacterized protein n=1 Tax=Brooklawnia cerclae TaxID=349934 RepID=A0ABX0SJK2_9ACTN|nr:hypothetical protein [Brooklawnia cerclae]NIH58509.1 hypothetical protein [Brooklawnia cerclae]
MSDCCTPTDDEIRASATRIGAWSEDAYDRWLADHDNKVAQKALANAVANIPFPIDLYDGFDHESLRAAYVQITNYLRDRSDEIRSRAAQERR